MNLEEFVYESITQIANGIKRAQEASRGSYLVSPPHTDKGGIKGNAPIPDQLEKVDFDIAVTAADKTNAGGGLSVAFLKLGGDHANENLNVSRVRFQVTVRWPRQALES